jgi:hypothetical protein
MAAWFSRLRARARGIGAHSTGSIVAPIVVHIEKWGVNQLGTGDFIAKGLQGKRACENAREPSALIKARFEMRFATATAI